MPTKNWRSIRLPKRHLVQLMHLYSMEYARIRRQVARLVSTMPSAEEVRQRREHLHLGRDRAARVMNQRQRLRAAYWAGWVPARHETWIGRRIPRGVEGPKWLGGRP